MPNFWDKVGKKARFACKKHSVLNTPLCPRLNVNPCSTLTPDLLDSSLCSTSRRAHFTPQDVPNFPSSSCSTCRPSAPLPPVPRIHAMLPRLARLRHCPPFDPNSINKFSPRFAVSRQLPPILQPTLPISPETPNSPRNSPTRRITFSKPHGHNLAGDERPHVRVLYKGN